MVAPAYAPPGVEYSQLMPMLLRKATALALQPVWRARCFGGGILKLSNCAEGTQALRQLANAASLRVAINQMRGTETGDTAGKLLRNTVWKLSTEKDSFSAHADRYARRFASARISIEHDEEYPTNAYTLMLSSPRSAISQEMKNAWNSSLRECGHDAEEDGPELPAQAQEWRKYTQGNSEATITWTSTNPLNPAELLAECWYIGEYLDLTVHPLTDVVLVGRFPYSFGFRPHAPYWR